ncbi:SDR family NAD(P)-dependent oxidoreductase [Streptomyces mirabilis]
MLPSGCGSIVFTASEAALRGSTAGATYTASKQGIVSLTKSLAVPYRSEEIRTYAVAPGPTATNIRIETRAKAHGP